MNTNQSETLSTQLAKQSHEGGVPIEGCGIDEAEMVAEPVAVVATEVGEE